MAVASIDEILRGLEKYKTGQSSGNRNAPQYSTSAPVPNGRVLTPYPSALKELDVSKKTGIVTAYLTVYRNDDGSPFIDSYNDEVFPGCFTKTIATLDAFRKSTNNPWLCPSLWQHDRNELIGGIARLSEDSKGVIYECQLAMGVRRAQEALDLASQKMIGSSYGYDPIHFSIQPGNVRRLTEIGLREQSFVSFPANPLNQILDVKSSFFSQVQGYSRSPMQERSTSELAQEMLTLFGNSHNRRAAQRKDNYRYSIQGTNAYVQLESDGTVSIVGASHLSTDTASRLASILYQLDSLDSYSEPSGNTGMGSSLYGESSDKRYWLEKDRLWRLKKSQEYRPWDCNR